MAHTLISQILGLGAQLIPSGGTTGQVLSKSSNTDYAVVWSTVTGGSGGGEPIFLGSPAYTITTTNISNWNIAYGWGNHALAGYLTSETDPVFRSSPSYGITSTLISHWNTAYGWGNWATQGFLTAETDPIFTASAAHGISSGNITNWNSAYTYSQTYTWSNYGVLSTIKSSGGGTQALMDNGTYATVLTSIGGSNTQIQYNNAGSLAGSSTLTFTSGTNTLSSTNIIGTNQIQIGNSLTYLSKDVSGNLNFTDAITGTKTLAQLVASASNYWSIVTGGINYAGKVGVNTPSSLTDTLTVNGNISATNFNSNYFRYNINNNLLIGPNAGGQETGNNKLYIANTNTTSPLIYGEFNNQLLKFYASVYLGIGYSLNFSNNLVNITNTATNNLTFQDAVANSGSPVTLTSLINGTYNSLKSDFSSYSTVTAITASKVSTWNSSEPGLGNPSVNGYVLSSTTAGVRSWVLNGSGGGMTNPMTSIGDMIVGGTSGTPTRLAIGATSQYLTVVAGTPSWSTFPITGVTTGSPTFNTGLGFNSLYGSIGSYNTGVGYGVLINMSSGAGNTGLGSNSLSSLSNASYNTSVGYDSLNNINNNSRNTAIGAYAGSSNSTGSNNVYIGYYAGYYDTNSNVFYLDNQDRYSWSLAQSSALLFGQFSGTPSSQTLVTNSAFTATYGINIPYGQTYKINGVPISTGTSYITSLTTTGSSGSSTVVSGVLNVPTYTLIGLGGQPQLNGTGFIKASGTTISYDNSTYLTTTSAASTYQPLITLTTTGSNGSSSFISNTLNIPTYTLSGLGGQPLSTNLTSLGGLLYPSSLSFVKMSSSGTFTLDTNTYLTTSSASSTYQPIISLTTTGTSGPATLIGNVLNIPQYSGGGGGMVYPGTTGIVYYNGSGWGTSYSTSGSGTTLALVNSPTFVGTSTFNAISATTINGLTFTGTLGGTLNVGSGVNLSNLATLSYSSLSFVKMSASGTFSLDTNSYQLSSTAYNTSNANLNSVNWTTNALSVSGAAVLNSSLTINQSANAKFILYDQTSGDGYWNIYSSGTALYFRSSNYATVLYLNGSSNTISGNLNNIGGIFQINGNNLSKALITGGADPIPVATTSSTGLLPILAGGTSSWLRSDGTWQAIPIFTNFTQGVVPPPSFATNDHFLSTDGTWLVPIPANTNLGTSGSVARISGNLHTYIGGILSSGTTTLFTYTLPGNSIVNQGDIIDIYAIFSASSSNISAISLIMNTSLSSYECDSPSITANGMVKIHYQICWLDPVYGYSIVACEELIYGTSYYTYTSGVITGDWLTTSSQTYSLRVSFTSGSLSFLYGYLTLSPAT